MASILVTAGVLFGASIPLPDEAVVGRLASCTVQLPSTQISRQHARIFCDAGRWFLEDLESRNGTRLNQQPVVEPAPLKPGDVIHVGEISLLFDPVCELRAARYGEAWVLLANPELGAAPYLQPIGEFGGAPGDLAGLSHLMAATVEEEGLVRGILQLVHDRLRASEVVLIRLGGQGRFHRPLGVVAQSGPVPVHLGLLELVVDRGRAAAIKVLPRTTLVAGKLESSSLGGPALISPLRLEGRVSAALCISREAGAPAFTPEEVSRVAALTALVAPALDNGRRAQLQRRRHRAWVDPDKSEGLLSGPSQAAQTLALATREAAVAGGPVLLVGPAGTGKERIARLIHAWSDRWEGPLVQVACATLNEAQLELLLFGRAALSQEAPEQRLDRAVLGKVSLADGGTLYLDRVETLPPAVQDRLLRLLQSGHLVRLRSTRTGVVDVRVVASSEDRLEDLKSGGMRPDLLRLLATNLVEVPALAERLEDLETLVDELLARLSVRSGRSIRQVTVAAYAALRRQPWVQNLRELEATLARLLSLTDADVITAEDVELALSVSGEAGGTASRLSDTLRESERRVLAQAVGLSEGDLGRSAALLGMSQRDLRRRLKALGLA